MNEGATKVYQQRTNSNQGVKLPEYPAIEILNNQISTLLSPHLQLTQSVDSEEVRSAGYIFSPESKLRNAESELSEAKLVIKNLIVKHKSEIHDIIENTEITELIIALNAEVEAAKKKADGLEMDNRVLRLKVAKMEQADANKTFDFDVWNTIAMKGGSVQNDELTSLTKTVMELRGTVAKLAKEVEDRDIKLREATLIRRQAQTNDGYHMLTIAELRDSLEFKDGLVSELKTIKSEYHQQIEDMRKRIEILESDGSGRGRIGSSTVIVDQGGLATLRAKNDVLENMLEGFMRTLEIVRRSGGMDMTVGGVYRRTQTSFEFCSHLAKEKSQLDDIAQRFEKQVKEIQPMILKLKEKKVTGQQVKEWAAGLLNSSQDYIDLLEEKVQQIDNLPLINNIRAQLYDIKAPLRMVLATLRHHDANELIDYDLALDNEELYQLKSEMKMLRIKVSTLETENAGLATEISLLEDSSNMSTDSVAYRLALLRQQYKDQILELELTLEEVLTQAQDELRQAYLEVRQLQEPRNLDWLESIMSLTDKLHAKLQVEDDKLRTTEASCDRRILALMERYEQSLSDLEVENGELKEEVYSLNEKLESLRRNPGEVSEESGGISEEEGEIERVRSRLRDVQSKLTKMEHKNILENESTLQKQKSLLREIKMWHDRCESRDLVITQLREGLKRQEAEMAAEGRLMGKMSENLIDKLQKRLAEQQRKLEQLGTNSDLMSDGEKRQLDAEIAALHKDLRIKEVELEELGAESKFTIERLQKENKRLTNEKNRYSDICSKLRGEINQRNKSEDKSQWRADGETKRRRDQIQTLSAKLITSEETVKNLRRKILTLTSQHEGEVENIVNRITNQKENHEKSTWQFRHKYETQIGDLIKTYEDRILKIRASFEVRIKKLKEVGKPNKQRSGMLRDNQDNYIKTLKADHKTRIRNIVTRFKNQLNERDNIIGRFDVSLLGTLSKFKETVAECDELESAHQRAITVLWNQVTQIDELLDSERSKCAENDRKRRELEASINNLKNLFEASESRLDKNFALLEEQNEAMKVEHKVDLFAVQEEIDADRKKKSADVRIRWPRRRNISLILSLRHDNYLNIWQ